MKLIHWFLAFQEASITLLLQIRTQNNQILSFLNNEHKSLTSLCPNLPVDLPVTLPLRSQDDMIHLEKYLEEDNNMTALILYFASICGKDITSKVNNLMRRLLTNSLATHYSFYGQRQDKRAINDLRVKNAITGAVRIGLPDATEKEIEDVMKLWLKHAPQRLRTEIKKK